MGEYLKNNRLLQFGLLLIPIYLTLLLLLNLWGGYWLSAILPLGKGTMTATHQDYLVHDLYTERKGGRHVVVMDMTVIRFSAHKQGTDSVRTDRTVGFTANGMFDYPVLVFSLLGAWVFVPWRTRRKALFIAVPLVIAASLFDLHVNLVARAESGYPVDILTAHIRQFGFDFLTNGGRPFMSVCIVLLSLAPFVLRMPVASTPAAGKKKRKKTGRRK